MNEIDVTDRNDPEYTALLNNVSNAIEKGKGKAAAAINSAMVQTYWQIGQYIVEFEQSGHEKAEYGSNTLKMLAADLSIRYGKGYSWSNIYRMRQLYLSYENFATLSQKLNWSHYVELLKIDNSAERAFYERECIAENWGVRELKRQMKSMLYHRLALSGDKSEVMRLSREGQIIEKPEDIIKEPYVLEFTGLPNLPVYKEGDLEEALVNNLSQFFLELGKGFTYVGRQQKMVIAGRTYKVDLVFYHRILKCFVLIDLKIGEVQHEDIGQMNFYLNYYKQEMNTEGDSEPIGLILGAYQDKLVMQYALQNITNQLFVSRYQLYLPDREQLEAEFRRFMNDEE
ncbi:PDDEXK nuclease domain-containing protein [Ruminococcus sp. HUN007]|uniref:PDDEXK nuclease domain-containing protein n=1 Tax=Ruminococcus sp. HUN007 TaxID=1514668 RepID=UPI0005D23CC5|nr:PDDEXK nuclease domain-containing protein [Ruminococcus sp. HUN007]